MYLLGKYVILMVYDWEYKVLNIIKNYPFAKIYQFKYFIFFVGLTLISYCYVDKKIAIYFYQLCQQADLLSKILLVTSKLVQGVGSGAFLFPVIFLSIGALIYYQQKNKLLNAMVIIAWCMSVMNIITGVLKYSLGRARPILYAQQDVFGFDFFNLSDNYLSFPSGHTVNITVLVAIMSYFFPKKRGLWIVIGILMVMFRIVYLKHYISDVLLSCYLTLLVLPVAWFILEKLSNRFPQYIFIRRALENKGLEHA